MSSSLSSLLICLGVLLQPAAWLSSVEGHQHNYGHGGSQALGGQKSWSEGHSYFRWRPHQISLPRPSFSVRRVPLPFPYPVFRHHQVPMYDPKTTHMPSKTMRVPVKIPKYYPVPVHKVIEVPRYIEVPVEVPIYQEVIVRRPVEVPVPYYITRKAVSQTQGAHTGATAPATYNVVDTGASQVKESISTKTAASALVPVSRQW